MNARTAGRTTECDRSTALSFIKRAEEHMDAIAFLSTDENHLDSAATLAVSAAINASDAACCARLRRHSRGQDHRAAVELLATVAPKGEEMARDLRRVLQKKDDAQYRHTPLSAGDARKMIEWTRRLVGNARTVVDMD